MCECFSENFIKYIPVCTKGIIPQVSDFNLLLCSLFFYPTSFIFKIDPPHFLS